MIKVLFVSSEKSNKFGVSKVVNSLKKNLQKKVRLKFSNSIINFIRYKPNLIHIHGCWNLKLLLFFLISKLISAKVILSPHGMINPISFNQKKIKKLIGWYIYQKLMFLNSDLIIVNSLLEKKNLHRRIKNINKIYVIPHGIDIKPKKNIIKFSSKSKLKFVFFSRIHPSKNLEKLIDIWTNNTFLKNFELSIYGEVIDHKYFSKIKNKIVNAVNLKYHGPLYNNNHVVLSKYDVFLLPSKSENFGLVVLEAMSSGLYILLNKKLPWKILQTKGFGKLIDINSTTIVKEVKKLELIKAKIRNKKFKKKLLQFLKKNYDWKKLSDIYLFKYKSIFN